MYNAFEKKVRADLEQFKNDGVYKRLNYIDSPQGPVVKMEGKGDVIVLSSNNYLGLSDNPEVIKAGQMALEEYGAGTSSVRFICGTFTIHRELEQACARLVG
ncbi:MAG TPA: aminotransferase class I/II-fold pyridoxal phosphate-dependent enzyme, partial [Gemmatimonadales bacterium]|nr:aminotransferase class I/II-fold pyridoxal phosphate-dependent enzyme [Gemmatimonadales bacterium]